MTINKWGLKSAKMYVLMLPKCLKIGWIVPTVGNINIYWSRSNTEMANNTLKVSQVESNVTSSNHLPGMSYIE